jgi:CRP-like cAMP-binding protein
MYELLYNYFKEKTDVDLETFERISRYFKPGSAKRNEILLAEGEICKFNLFVNKGCVRFFTINEEGIELTRYFAFEGKFGTALSSLIDQEKSFETIQCVEKSELQVISRKDFFHLIETVPQVNFIYRDILEMAYITSQKRIYDFQGKNGVFALFLQHQTVAN